jgi:hypothetical protein
MRVMRGLIYGISRVGLPSLLPQEQRAFGSLPEFFRPEP